MNQEVYDSLPEGETESWSKDAPRNWVAFSRSYTSGLPGGERLKYADPHPRHLLPHIHPYHKSVEWEEAKDFIDTLEFAGEHWESRASGFWWRSLDDGTLYPMFLSDATTMFKCIPGVVAQYAWPYKESLTIYATWKYVKRGSNYGIAPADRWLDGGESDEGE